MAAALSRALKLPGKKGSELGEYDPLTQADSEDESEEDDLVLNYPRNGMGRGSCAGAGPETRGVDEEEELDDEEEDEDEERRGWKGLGAGQQGEGAVTGGGGSGAGQLEREAERKRARTRGAVRTAAFLLPLTCATLLVLLCAFLLPCPLRSRAQWERQLGDVGGVSSPPLALWDVNGDGIEDLLIAVMKITNNSMQSSSLGNAKEYSVAAVCGVSGEVMWQRHLQKPVSSLQCGLQVSSSAPDTRGRNIAPVCLLNTHTHLTAINASTGKRLWEVPAGEVESRAVAVPDLQGDNVPDLLIATLPADQDSDLSLVLHSGMTGSPIGQPVNFNLSAQGKLIGPLLHETPAGAYYILFGLGTVEAVSLRDLYRKATGKTVVPASLSVVDPLWEKRRKNNTSILIDIYSGSEQADYLLPLVAGVCSNHNNLDAASTRNSSRSDWVLVCASSRVSLLQHTHLHTSWTYNSSSIHSRPTVGHFNNDGVPDLLIQQSANGTRKVQIIDGARGLCLWEAEFVCPHLVLEASSILTTSGLSVFLFWAGEPLPSPRNNTKVSPPEPILRRLFLLHPAYPTILLQLNSTTDTAFASTVSYRVEQKDASYLLVLSRPVSGLGPGAQVLRSISVRAASTSTSALTVTLDTQTHTSTFQMQRFYSHVRYSPQ